MENQINTDCKICLEKITNNSLFLELLCNHKFHNLCLKNYYQTKIDERKFPIKCPDEDCKADADQSSIQIVLDQQYYDKYQEYSLSSVIDMNSDKASWCPTANCKYCFYLDTKNTYLECPICQKQYCMLCKVEYHQGQSCQEYQISNKNEKNDKAFYQLVQGQKFKQCPKCKFWIQKNEGCNHMTCRCGEQFCYACGGPYPKCNCINNINF